jgi:hypothetical protein
MRPAIDTITLKIPKGITENLEAQLKWDPPSWLKRYDKEKFLYIISKIVSLSTGNRKYNSLRLVPLSSIVLRYELGKHYRKFIDWLLDHKFIETDNHYIVGNDERDGKCKCYGLTKPYKAKKLIDFTLTNRFILTKILKWRKNRLSESVTDPMMARLYSMMDDFEVDIDSAKKELQGLRDSNKITEQQMVIEIDKCEKINAEGDEKLDLFIVRDDYSRIHTNITNISKRIRENHLYIGGKKAVGIDIVSSQPALLHSLFQDYVNRINILPNMVKSSRFYIELDNTRRDIRDKYVNKHNNYTGTAVYDPDDEITLSKLGFSTFNNCVSALNTDIKFFKSVLGNGIYEFFQFKWAEMYGESLERDDMKRLWLTYVFGRGDDNKKLSPQMESMGHFWDYYFPVLNKLLKYFKVGDYKTLSHTLQRKEADLIYNKLCPRVEDEFDITYSTVHDSIIVTEDVSDDVMNLFDEILDENDIYTTACI